MKTLLTVSWLFEADMLCRKLASYGIEAFIPDQFTVGVLPLHGNALGGIRIQVANEDFDKATSILREIHPSKDDKNPTCPQCGSSAVKARKESWLFFACLIIFVGIPLFWLKQKFECDACGHQWQSDPLANIYQETDNPIDLQ